MLLSEGQMSEGQMSDFKGAALMLDRLPKARALLGDKGYDAEWFRATGTEPNVIEYLVEPPSREELVSLIERMNIAPRGLLRQKGTPFSDIGLDDEKLTDDELVDAMIEHPLLINRPIVVGHRGVKLCRPSELVLDVLDQPLRDDFTKEDGEVVSAHG